MSQSILRINYSALRVPVCDRPNGNNRQRFRCWLDDGSPVGPETGLRSPALDGARWLVGQGVSPDRLMTTRAASSSVDSWKPAPVGSFAKLAVADPDERSASLGSWQGFPVQAGTEKQATTPPAGVVTPEKPQGGCSARSAVPFRSVGEIVASLIDAPSGAGDDVSNPATASVLSDAAQLKLPRNSRAASAHRKDSNHG